MSLTNIQANRRVNDCTFTSSSGGGWGGGHFASSSSHFVCIVLEPEAPVSSLALENKKLAQRLCSELTWIGFMFRDNMDRSLLMNSLGHAGYCP